MISGNGHSDPLGVYRILDLTNERGLYCGQLLASLGADVIKVEKPGGDPARNCFPLLHDTPGPDNSLLWLGYNTDKRSVTLDMENPEDRDTFRKLAATADAVVESFDPGAMARLSLAYSDLQKLNPGLVVTSISPFGQTGPYRDYKATDLTCWAMGSLLSITGDPDRPPVRVAYVPLSYLMAGMDAAWATAMALYWRGESGLGQHIDVSIQESVVRTSLPLREQWELTGNQAPRGSTRATGGHGGHNLRVVFPAKDGYVRYRVFPAALGIVENQALARWMEEEDEADGSFKAIDWKTFQWEGKTLEEAERIHDSLARFFLSRTVAELAEGAFRRDIKVEPVATPRDILRHPQLRARDYWQPLSYPHLDGTLLHPGRSCLLSKTPGRIRRRAPLIGEHNREVLGELTAPQVMPAVAKPVSTGTRPPHALAGVRVAAFIQGIAAPLAAVIMASHGADVVRIESRKRLEWHRVAGGPYLGGKPSPDAAAGYLAVNPGELGITLNMKHPRAAEVMSRIVKWADIVLDNFAGGAMARMGLGYEDLKKIRPDIIVLSAAIYGQTGPYAALGGYGGTLTALTGLPSITGFPGQPPQFPGLGITDYITPRASVLALIAALEHRRRTGEGQFIDAAQVEIVVHLLSPVLLDCQANSRDPARVGNQSPYAAPHGVYRCRGEEKWCAIAVCSDAEWQSFCRATGHPEWAADRALATLAGRLKNIEGLDRLVNEWTSARTPEEVMNVMQSAGIAAGAVHDGGGLARDPQLRHRGFYTEREHPGLGKFIYAGLPAQFSLTPHETGRSPHLGEHNEVFYIEKLGMPRGEYEHLRAEGVFE